MLSLVKRALWAASPRAFDRLVAPHRGQVFAIGIREGASPFALTDLPGNPVLTRDDVTDVPAAFVADPFMIHRDGAWHMFLEVFDRTCRLGRIGLATSEDGRAWRYRQVVLQTTYHMAYPSLVCEGADVFMIPDTPGRGVCLYRAESFPDRWQFETVLVNDGRLADATVLRFDGHWWMFAGCNNGKGKPMSLCLFHADALTGPWQPHAASPLAGDDARSRPAGNLFEVDGRLYRPAQDCAQIYGQRTRAMQITELTLGGYRDAEVESGPIQGPGRDPWNVGGMHHMDLHRKPDGGWIACVDGWH